MPAQIELGDGETVTCTFSNIDIDADDDGLTDDREALFGTDPFNPDTDGDGVADGQELLVDNTDPRDPTNGKGINEPERSPPDGGVQLPACPIAPGTFVPGISPRGVTLTQYGGGTVRELQHQLGDAESTSATFTLPEGSTATLIDTDLAFVIHSFVAPFFGIDVDLEEPAMHGVDSFRDLPITLCRLLFVRALR